MHVSLFQAPYCTYGTGSRAGLAHPLKAPAVGGNAGLAVSGWPVDHSAWKVRYPHTGALLPPSFCGGRPVLRGKAGDQESQG